MSVAFTFQRSSGLGYGPAGRGLCGVVLLDGAEIGKKIDFGFKGFDRDGVAVDIHEYNEQHAKSFVKRLRESANDWKNCEAVFSEIIVYRHYIRLAYERLIRKIDLDAAESDVIIERLDGTKAYLEIFCVMPSFPLPEDGKVVDVKTHTQTEMASIRQKLLRKVDKQKQFSKPRENYAVIELNNSIIVGDFTVLSSLSSGYTVTINKQTMQIESSRYNWENSIFEDQSTKFLKAIIYFDLGNYDSRKFIFNPNYRGPNNRVEPTP